MPDDKQKILNIMRNLEKDYKDGVISKEKYKYFKAKYSDKINDLNRNEATNRIRSMQGKPSRNRINKKKSRKAKKQTLLKRKEENDLVQKYILDPKKGDKEFNKTKKKSVDSGTYKLIAILVLVVGFTAGISTGIFALDFQDMSVVNAEAIVEDTSFPDMGNVTIEVNETKNGTDKVTVEETIEEAAPEDTYISDDTGGGEYEPAVEPSTGGGGSSGSNPAPTPTPSPAPAAQGGGASVQ